MLFAVAELLVTFVTVIATNRVQVSLNAKLISFLSSVHSDILKAFCFRVICAYVVVFVNN